MDAAIAWNRAVLDLNLIDGPVPVGQAVSADPLPKGLALSGLLVGVIGVG